MMLVASGIFEIDMTFSLLQLMLLDTLPRLHLLKKNTEKPGYFKNIFDHLYLNTNSRGSFRFSRSSCKHTDTLGILERWVDLSGELVFTGAFPLT